MSIQTLYASLRVLSDLLYDTLQNDAGTITTMSHRYPLKTPIFPETLGHIHA